MSTRHMIAYALIASIAAGAFIALWFAVFRQRWALRQRRRRFHRDRYDAAAKAFVRDRPALEAD